MRIIETIVAAAHEQGVTAYRLAKLSEGRISQTHAYRMLAGEGGVTLEKALAACDVLGVKVTARKPRARKRKGTG